MCVYGCVCVYIWFFIIFHFHALLGHLKKLLCRFVASSHCTCSCCCCSCPLKHFALSVIRGERCKEMNCISNLTAARVWQSQLAIKSLKTTTNFIHKLHRENLLNREKNNFSFHSKKIFKISGFLCVLLFIYT